MNEFEFGIAVGNERVRQMEKGYDLNHDRQHGVNALLFMSMQYAARGESVKSAALVQAAREVYRAEQQEMATEKVNTTPTPSQKIYPGLSRNHSRVFPHPVLKFSDEELIDIRKFNGSTLALKALILRVRNETGMNNLDISKELGISYDIVRRLGS